MLGLFAAPALPALAGQLLGGVGERAVVPGRWQWFRWERGGFRRGRAGAAAEGAQPSAVLGAGVERVRDAVDGAEPVVEGPVGLDPADGALAEPGPLGELELRQTGLLP